MTQPPSFAPLLSLLWTPLIAVTATWDERENGQIAVSAHGASIVPDRPRVLVQLYKTNLTHDLVLASGAFALNLLREDQLNVAHQLGFVSGRVAEKLVNIAHRRAETGSPVLDDCLGWLDCRVINQMDGGDMTCFLADVVDGRVISAGEPLWWREMRHRMPAAWQAEWDAKIAGEIEVSRATMEIRRR
jgi:flavin reductase (DIM6/NTAB) family NADH-FMN oxidoreductase RutF